MVGQCQASEIGGFVSDTLYAIDCFGLGIGSAGYQALAAPGGLAQLVLTSVMTIFVALIGYRMMLGETPDVRFWVASMATLGVVVAFSFSWHAFRIGVHDVIVYAPAELSKAVAQTVGIPGNRELIQRLDGVNSLLIELEKPVPKENSLLQANAPSPPPTSSPSPQPQAQTADPDRTPSTISPELRPWFLVAAIGPLATTRLAASLLIALAPFFFMTLLFPALRGFFSGWLRTILGLAVAQFAVMLALGVEVLLVESRLAMILRGGRIQAEIGARTPELQSLFVAFLGILIALIVVGIWALSGFKLEALARQIVERVSRLAQPQAMEGLSARTKATVEQQQPRALAIARPLIRDAHANASDPRWRRSEHQSANISILSHPSAHREVGAYKSPHQHRRQTGSRRSLSAGRRDGAVS